MKCREFKKWVGEYVDGELAASLKSELDTHMSQCVSCRKSYEAMAGAWNALGVLPPVEASPAFVSRFWTKVAAQDTRKGSFAGGFKNMFVLQRLVPVALTLSVVLIVGSVTVLKNYSSSGYISLFGNSDSEFVENIELAEHLDVISDMDWLEDMEVIQDIDGTNT